MAKTAIGTNPLTRHQRAVDAALTPRKKKIAKKKATRPVGRPPAGLAGEKVSGYERTTLWLPPATKRQLNALSRYVGRPQWGVIVEAVTAYEKSLSAADRKAIAQMLKR